ncbi:MAG: pectin acetylesterase-family hydrolase [Actinomycetota bacterium]|nr:pectin acetylesterase-family hydrolase [Actinomycetota bacterium]
MNRWRALLAAGLLCGALVACSDGGGLTDSPTPTTGGRIELSDTAFATLPSLVGTTTTVPVQEWEAVTAPADCMCSDGSEFTYFVRTASPTKVLFFMEGGGACFNAETCGPGGETYKRTVGNSGTDLLAGTGTGIFDFENPDNPFADYSVVYVPYCTGDVHIGNTTHDYGDGVVIQHKGYVNGTTALAALAERFPDVAVVVMAGESAGSIPTPLYAGLAHDLLPAARLTVLADGSGAYPDVPALNLALGTVWGTANAIPEWPENEGLTPEQWSLPGLFVQAGLHAPDITFARHDYAFDQTQAFFSGLVGLAADDLVTLIDLNETQIEAAGIDLASYITPGDSHTVLHAPEFYTEVVNGVSLLDWVTALVAGVPVDDVHCTECTVGS